MSNVSERIILLLYEAVRLLVARGSMLHLRYIWLKSNRGLRGFAHRATRTRMTPELWPVRRSESSAEVTDGRPQVLLTRMRRGAPARGSTLGTLERCQRPRSAGPDNLLLVLDVPALGPRCRMVRSFGTYTNAFRVPEHVQREIGT